MGRNVTEKILGTHVPGGEMKPGARLQLAIDQTLIQDATGTMACLEFEAIGIERVQTEVSVTYTDHNLIQADYRNPDDHRYLQDVAAKYGMICSLAGNGICHQVHLERFARPGGTLLGSDSHTPTAGGIGMIAIGAGGLDVALAMAGEPFTLGMPKIVRVQLTGALRPFVSAKDVILEVLRRIGVKGGVGKVLEYGGPGAASLSVPERATITNMGAETGATFSIFPSDEVTRRWLRVQGRESQWVEIGRGRRRGLRFDDRDRSFEPRAAGGLPVPAGQGGSGEGAGGAPGGPGHVRVLHEFLAPGHPGRRPIS